MSNKKLYALFAVFVVVATVLSACGAKAPAATSAPAASKQVEVFSWWVGPGEADGLAAMIKIFDAKYPNDKFVNASVAGGAGTNAKAVLATRLQGGDPPDSGRPMRVKQPSLMWTPNRFNRWMISSNQVALARHCRPALLPLISKDGHPYSVPVNIHRSNVMWYNPKVLSDAGVTVPAGGFANYDDFFAACDKIKAAGKICLALGPAWTAEHLFENVMIGTLGADGWAGLWTGTTDWASADVTKALEQLCQGTVLHQQRCCDSVRLAAGCPVDDQWRCSLQYHGRLGVWLLCESRPQRTRSEAAHRLRLGSTARNQRRVRVPGRQFRSAGGEQESCGHHGLVDRCRFERRPGSFQPAQGFDLCPHRLRSKQIQRVFPKRCERLGQQ